MTVRIAILSPLLLLFGVIHASCREWTDSTGKYRVEAKLVSLESGFVRLRTETGRVVSVPFHKLSIGDQKFVEADKAAKEILPHIAGNKARTVDEWKVQRNRNMRSIAKNARTIETFKAKQDKTNGNVADLVGQVIGITDGDTITVLVDKTSHKIRLEGIDCPEIGQPFSSVARKFISSMCFEKEVTVRVAGSDRYNRTLGEVIVDGQNVNRELVNAGLAWWYHKYSDDIELAKHHLKAREENRGLWDHKKPIPPWKWRRLSVDKQQDYLLGEDATRDEPRPAPWDELAGYLSKPTDRASGFSLPVVPTIRGPPAAEHDSRADNVTVYVTRTGSKYHRSNCRYLRKSKIPTSLKEANQRYSPCSVCNPPLATADVSRQQNDSQKRHLTGSNGEDQAGDLPSSKRNQPTGGVAENGSYYGETSKATGRPKTVRVKGYYRKDGTYVRGHYRSRPRR